MKKKGRLKVLIILLFLSAAFLLFLSAVTAIRYGSFKALAGYLFLRSDTEEGNHDKTTDISASSLDNRISKIQLYINCSVMEEGIRQGYQNELDGYKAKISSGKFSYSDSDSLLELKDKLKKVYQMSKSKTEDYYTKVASDNKADLDSDIRSEINTLTSEYEGSMSSGDYKAAYEKVAAIENAIDEYTDTYVSLDVKNIEQYPELPTGCESVAATILLNYYGMNLNKTDIADKYLVYSDDPDKGFTGGSPHEESLGAGYFCNAGPVVDAMNKAINDRGASLRVVNITGESFDGLFYYVRSGHPVVMWVLTDMTGSNHTMVMTGYDKKRGVCSFADPLKKGITEYPIEACRRAYEQRGKQGIIVEEK